MSSNEPIYSKPIPKHHQANNRCHNNGSNNRAIVNRAARHPEKYGDCPESTATDLSYRSVTRHTQDDSSVRLDYGCPYDRNYGDFSRSKLRASNSRIRYHHHSEKDQLLGQAGGRSHHHQEKEQIGSNRNHHHYHQDQGHHQPLYANDPFKRSNDDQNSDDYGFLNFESRRVPSSKLHSPRNEYSNSGAGLKAYLRNKEHNNTSGALIGIQQIQEQRLINLVPHGFEEPTLGEHKSSHRKTKHAKCDSNKASSNPAHERRLPNDLDLSKMEHRTIYDEQYFKSGDTLSKKQESAEAGGKLASMMQMKSPKRETNHKISTVADTPDGEGKIMRNAKVKHHSNSKTSGLVNGGSSKPSISRTSPKQLDLLVEQAKRFYCRDWAFRKLAQCLEQRPTSRTCGTLVLGGSGSGKTTLCREIAGQNPTSNVSKGTLGTLNRKLLAVYYVQPQNSDTPSMADFIRSIVLQLISHSTYLQTGQTTIACAMDTIPKSPERTLPESLLSINNINNNQSLLITEITKTLDDDSKELDEKTNGQIDDLSKNLIDLSFEEESSKGGDLLSEIILDERIKKFCDKKSESILNDLRRTTDKIDQEKTEIGNETSDCDKEPGQKCDLFERKLGHVVRQESDPTDYQESEMHKIGDNNYFTHPPSSSKNATDNAKGKTKSISSQDHAKDIVDKVKNSPSKIPVAAFRYPNMSDPNYSMSLIKVEHKQNLCQCNEEISLGGESIANIDNMDVSIIEQTENDLLDDSMIEQTSVKSECEPEPEIKIIKDENKDSGNNSSEQTINKTPSKNCDNDSTSTGFESLNKIEVDRSLKPQTQGTEIPLLMSESIPPPLPTAPQNSRNYIANAFLEKLLTDPEIQECLNIENIDKNPDDCFKKAILFPLLEIDPPKNCLLFMVDSIDEKTTINSNVNNTLTKEEEKPASSINNSKTITELLANHHHLFPQWLLLVCTAKKQSKSLTKMFTGFRKITLDDLRKHQIVRDIQQYILARLDSELNLRQHISRDTAEMLNQLHIKSNGCFLYLEKVLDGVSDNFIVLREIKEIPGTLNGLYLWLCQRLFNKKQFSKAKPLLNVLLAARNKVTKTFLYKCLLTTNNNIGRDDYMKRLHLLRKVVKYDGKYLTFFHQSFAEWLVDVKHCTQKYLCSAMEGSCMIAMYYTLRAKTLCSSEVHNYVFHLTRVEQYFMQKQSSKGDGNKTDTDWHFITLMWLIDSGCNVEKSLFCGSNNLCDKNKCEHSYFKDNINLTQRTRDMVDKYYMKSDSRKNVQNDIDESIDEIIDVSEAVNKENELKFREFLLEFFRPSLPRDNKVLRLLLEAGAKTQIQDYTSSQISLDSITDTQSVSYMNPSEELVDDFFSMSESFQLDAATANGATIIHTLAADGSAALLERAIQLSKKPIDLELEDRHGQTPLNLAARHGHTNVVKVLLKAGAEPDHADCDGWTALRAAAWGGHTEVVELLVSHGCDVDRADSDGRSALRAAAWSGHEDIVRALLKAGASVDRTDQEGRTALIAAAYMGHSEIVEQLLDCGADINHSDSDGRSALSVAALCVPASAGYAKVVSVLLERGAAADHQDKEGMTPLLVASFEGHKEVCELLLEYEADPDLAEHTGRVPLWGACSAGHGAVVELLLFWGAGIDCMDHEGRTVLSVACAQGNVEVVRQLLDRGLDETHRDNAGWTPLHYAAFEGHLEVVQALLESGAKVDESDNDGKSCLHLASQEGYTEVVQILLDHYSAPVDQKAHDGKTALRLSALEGHYEVLQLLLQNNADVNTKDADGRSTLYILALENKLAMARYLLEHGRADPNCRDCEGRTALHVSAWQGHSEMVQLLISVGGATIDALDNDCRTALHSACWQGHGDVVELLLKWGAQPDHACNQGATALGIASQEGHYDCVVKLLQYNADPHHSDHCGRTPLKLATKSQRTEVVRLLESYIKSRKTGGSNNSITTASTAVVRSPNISPDSTHRLSCLLVDNHAPSTHDTLPCQSVGNHSSLSSNLTGSTHSSKHDQSNHNIPFSQQLQSFTRYGHTNASAQMNPHNSHVLSPLNSDSGSPLYASPPHSPISDIASPVNPPANSIGCPVNTKKTDNHFARDTHMRIILGNNTKEKESSSSKSKRNAIATNPAFRLIRSGLDSAAANLRRTGQAFSQSHRHDKNKGNETAEGGATKSGTFQWRRETPL